MNHAYGAIDFCSVYGARKPDETTITIACLAAADEPDVIRDEFSEDQMALACDKLRMCKELGCTFHGDGACLRLLSEILGDIHSDREEYELDMQYDCRRCGSCRMCNGDEP